jgi:hypothetical protein
MRVIACGDIRTSSDRVFEFLSFRRSAVVACYIINESTANTSITMSVTDTSSFFPSNTFKTVQLKNPQMIPCVIE